MATITPVIMSGGAGTRLWPLSRKAAPKQYRALVSSQTLFAETVARVDEPGTEPPIIVCARGDADLVSRHAQGARIITEPMGRNTAPVAIVASLAVAENDPNGLVLLLPADHHVRDRDAFWKAVRRGEVAARDGHLVTLGIKAERPETGYGYIRRGAQLAPGVFAVDAFKEKPDAQTAAAYLADGGYAWNAGIFLFRAADLLAEAERYVPEMLAQTRAAYERGERSGTARHLDPDAFSKVAGDSIDYAIMERTDRAAVVSPVEIGWDDIGSWSAVAELSREQPGEAPLGDSVLIDCKNTYVRTDGPLVAAVGLEGVVVVATGDAILVMDEKRAQDVKSVVEALKQRGRDDLL